jgi:threonine/homoserine/homoserine lactone efflux protein
LRRRGLSTRRRLRFVDPARAWVERPSRRRNARHGFARLRGQGFRRRLRAGGADRAGRRPRHSQEPRRRAASGVASGLGAAVADAVYAFAAALGLASLTQGALGAHAWTLRAAGGIALCALGVHALRASASAEAQRRAGTGGGTDDATGTHPQTRAETRHARAFLGTLAFTLANPVSILSFAAVAASLGVGDGASRLTRASAVVAGVFAGSALWWLMLATGVGALRRRVTDRALRWLNRAGAVTLIAFGAASIALG